MSDDELREHIARIERCLNELLRRIPEPRCRLCGQPEAWHPNPQMPQMVEGQSVAQMQMLQSHFFTP